MKYWLMKTEPSTYSIDDLEREGTTQWEGIRNYQARNFMRDQMRVGDRVLIYHSNEKPPGVVGIAEVSRLAYPDFFAWDPNSRYFDPKSSPEKPIWQMVDVRFVEKLTHMVTLDEIKGCEQLEGMLVRQRGSRLSIQPVSSEHFDYIVGLGKGGG